MFSSTAANGDPEKDAKALSASEIADPDPSISEGLGFYPVCRHSPLPD